MTVVEEEVGAAVVVVARLTWKSSGEIPNTTLQNRSESRNIILPTAKGLDHRPDRTRT